jgi:tetratricopeptide (TPR) repeat protein
MMLYPYPLRIDEYYSQKLAPAAYPLGLCAISGIFWTLAILAIAIGLIRRNSFAVLGLFWMVSLLPVSHIISFPTSMAERFSFLPSAFFALAFSLLVSGAGFQSRNLARSIAAATCIFLFMLTFLSTREYKDRYVYMRGAVSEVPGAAVLHNQLGLAGLDRGWQDSAERSFNWALMLSPNYPEATMNLALLKLKQGDSSAAVSLLQKVVSISPDYGDAYFNLGMTLNRLGRTEEAEPAFEKAHQLEPENPNAAFELAEIQFNKGDWEGAKKLADSALQTAPWHLPSIKLRIRIALTEKDYALARELIPKAENIAPHDPELERFKSVLP